MMIGEVNTQREIMMAIRVRGAEGVELNIEAVLDTGFNDFLTLPGEIVQELALPRLELTPVMLADGNIVLAELYEVRVHWDGELRTIPVHATSGDPLIGMSLLYGSLVTLEAVEGGSVTIEPLE